MNGVNPFLADSLDWLAFRYVAGELESGEAEAFESRLERDTDACEALVRAVRLVERVGAAGLVDGAEVLPLGDRAGRRRLIGVLGAGSIAASLAVMAVLGSGGSEARRGLPVESVAIIEPADSLVLAWIQVRQPGGPDDWLAAPDAEEGAEAGLESGEPSWLESASALESLGGDAEIQSPEG